MPSSGWPGSRDASVRCWCSSPRGATTTASRKCLVISPETARTHIQNVLGKLDVHSRLEAAAFVTQNGILDDLAVAAR